MTTAIPAVRVIEHKRATITLTEDSDGWTIRAEHKKHTFHGNPQTYTCRIAQCSYRKCHCRGHAAPTRGHAAPTRGHVTKIARSYR